MNAETPVNLVAIPKESAFSVFTTEGAIDPYLARIRAEVEAFVPDISTDKGRKAVASMAYKVAQSKTYLETVGKALADEQKEIPKKIDVCRKKIKDTLDAWRDEVRKPLTDWEAQEEARVKGHTDKLTVLNELARNAMGRESASLRESLAYVDEVVVASHLCDEFEADYQRAKTAAHASLTEALAAAEIREAEQAELAKLRAEAAARAAADREEQIRKAAAEAATKAAELAAQAKIDAERAAADAARKEAADTEARLKREAEEAAAKAAAETAKREADTQHRATVNRAAAAAFVAGGLSEEAAKQAVTLIAQKVIPAVTISY